MQSFTWFGAYFRKPSTSWFWKERSKTNLTMVCS